MVCESSNDPVGVELAGAAKNAAALAAGATEAQGLNAAGAAAGHIFAEVWRFAETQGARPESLIGLAGTGDLVATALAPQSRNRRAGELLGEGVPTQRDPRRASVRPSRPWSPCRSWLVRSSAAAWTPPSPRSRRADRRRAAARRVGGARPGDRAAVSRALASASA